MTEYVRYYHEDRTHLGLAKDTPASRCGCLNPDFFFTRFLFVGQPESVCLLVGHRQNKESRRNLDLTMLSRNVRLGVEDFEEPEQLNYFGSGGRPGANAGIC
jgi:hypothetical protein